MSSIANPRLTLVGAGPGDPDLITVKGIKALNTANVVLYDALVNIELLKHAHNAIKIFVGKRRGNHRYSQDEINRIIVDKAYQYGHVVRLKGGDSFIFGRGGEEIEYAKLFNLETNIVAGLSSSLSVPSSVGLPLTSRGVSDSVWIMTATTKTGELSKNIALAAKANTTVVLLMGMNKLAEIVSIFKNEGKDYASIAIIQEGTTVNEKMGIGVIHSIEKMAIKKSFSAPAIIVIGDVVDILNEDKESMASILSQVAVNV